MVAKRKELELKPKLVLATENKGKRQEMCDILAENLSSFQKSKGTILIATVDELGLKLLPEVGSSFKENALEKARFVYAETGLPALSDDSGLIVDILVNAPGILSARWSGQHGDDLANNELLLSQLSSLPDSMRTAHFTTAVALCYKLKEVVEFGNMYGKITRQMHGNNGFGYDTIFVPNDYNGTPLEGKTTAELNKDQKNSISHRFQALRKIIPALVEILG
ncbi:MAG: non-canonical purine NTP pyrophosphatase [Candidatus Ancillula sp.]|jgi:XTP/dITP diphosphohydrolase|nr:non-canonical purine NTP pyrophosphatase [Candidatus Ancillula sp.]